MECYECGEGVDKLWPDHRTPPLAVEDCLCDVCAIAAVEELVEEAQSVRQELDLNILNYRRGIQNV